MLDFNQDLQHKENKEVKKFAIDLDTVFQIADEIPIFPNTCLVKIESPEKLQPVSGPSFNNGEAVLLKNSGSTTTANV